MVCVGGRRGFQPVQIATGIYASFSPGRPISSSPIDKTTRTAILFCSNRAIKPQPDTTPPSAAALRGNPPPAYSPATPFQPAQCPPAKIANIPRSPFRVSRLTSAAGQPAQNLKVCFSVIRRPRRPDSSFCPETFSAGAAFLASKFPWRTTLSIYVKSCSLFSIPVNRWLFPSQHLAAKNRQHSGVMRSRS